MTTTQLSQANLNELPVQGPEYDRSQVTAGVVHFGVGGAVAAGPALVAIFYPLVGATGLIFIFLALFAAAAFMAHSLRGTQPGFDGVPAVKTLSEVSEVSKGA